MPIQQLAQEFRCRPSSLLFFEWRYNTDAETQREQCEGARPDFWDPRLSVNRTVSRACVMSSYAKYCRDQAAECARRARLANSPDVAANSRTLEQRWLKLAARAGIGAGPSLFSKAPAVAVSRR